MIKEQTIARIALAIAVIGTIGLLAFEQAMAGQQTEIKQINDSHLGKKVTVKGIVEWKKQTKSALMFEINDGNKITGILLGNTIETEQQKIMPKAFLAVQGTIQKNNQKLELIVEKVTEWKN